MQRREPCRNFQRGSCQYGERCKFLHVQQPRKSNVPGFGAQNSSHQQQTTNPFGFGSGAHQQQKSNPFGFGSQTASHQQQNANPFGFGVQNNSQSKGVPDFGSKQQFKPFENKWTRSSSSAQSGASRQSDNSQSGNHKCTDPETCKHQIAEDYEHEKPLWKLTCYGHNKYAPCDIVGDVSFEELRAAAYADSKQGMSLQSIVERERNLLNSKLLEFENLLHKPYTVPVNSSLLTNENPYTRTTQNNDPFTMQLNSSTTNQSHFLGPSANPFSRATPTNDPPSVSSFSELGPSLNMNFGSSSLVVNNGPAQPGLFQTQASLSNSNLSVTQSSSASTPAGLSKFPYSTTQQAPGNESSFSTMFQSKTDGQLSSNLQVENVSVDASVWLKQKWNPGEIPEAAPPDEYVR
ncbi:hypothetical protein L6164_005846 [Bauhinia variegata]|uniref:Uncharacterized protein n=1 Tax=Bauhinia variegata TaxID=167791 RepID=A0ACB9PT17_BAUVA|nr:hypothetical protein L6164_005846 [Bauhinia variegata]